MGSMVVTGPAFVTEYDYVKTRNKLWAVKPYVDITPGKGRVSIRMGYVKTNTRVEFSSVRRYKAFTLGIGIRLLGK